MIRPAIPAWMTLARSLIGTRETPGPRHNPTILGWAKAVARFLGIAVTDDETAWCGLFVAFCLYSVGIDPVRIAIRAKSWAAWGVACEPCLGAILVFGRAGGGHVGFYEGEDATHYHVLGGNQSNAVNVMRIAKNRLIATRWPAGRPIGSGRVVLAGGTISSNEA